MLNCPGWAETHSPHASAFQNAAIAGTHQRAQLVFFLCLLGAKAVSCCRSREECQDPEAKLYYGRLVTPHINLETVR